MKTRLSLGGITILLCYTLGFLWLFRRSSWFPFESEEDIFSFRSIFLGSFAFASASLNVASHSAVALGALDDTFTLSILIGVGFDVFSNLLYLFFWASFISRRNDQNVGEYDGFATSILDTIFWCFCIVHYTINMAIHTRALFMADSFHRTSSVVRSAWNNIKGDPGYAYLDHLFAYTDLGSHSVHLIVSFLFLRWQKSLPLGVLILLAYILIAIGFVTNQKNTISFSVDSSKSNSEDSQRKKDATITVDKRGKLVCNCKVCKKAKWGTAFCIDIQEATLCRLWFLTFKQLSLKLEEIPVTTSREQQKLKKKAK